MTDQERNRAQANLLIRQEKWDDAMRLYKTIISLDPRDGDIGNLGAILRKKRKIGEAMELYKRWEHMQTKSEALRINAINCALEAKDLTKAEKWINEAIECGAGKHIEILEVRLMKLVGRTKEVKAKVDHLIEKYPGDIEIKLEAGHFYYLKGERKRAIELFEEVLTSDTKNIRAYANLITINQEIGNEGSVNDLINGLDEITKKNKLIRGSIAYALMKQQKVKEAQNLFAELCEEEPEQPLHWLNRSACLKSLKCTNLAKNVAMKGYSIHPGHREVRQALSQYYAEIGMYNQAIRLIENEGEESYKSSNQHMYNMQFIGEGYNIIESGHLKELAEKWEMHKIMSEGIGHIAEDRVKEKTGRAKIRIGYLSTDFCNHPVGRFILPIIKGHDNEAVEVYAIDAGRIRDGYNKKVEKACKKLIDISTMNDIEAARRISDLNLDVLVELNGYTSGSRMSVLVHKPSKIQLSYLGYFAPTYLKCIDGWIGDHVLFKKLNKVQREAHRLLNIDGGYMTLQDGELPDIENRTRGKVRFGTFNHSRKLSKEAISLFCKIMKKATDSELVLKSISFIEDEEKVRVRNLFMKEKLEPERLIMLPWVEGRENHLKNYNNIDIALDPFPYGGATTTCEALGMGVPVITLHSKGMVGALSASILDSAGLRMWIADNEMDYIEKALNEFKKGIRTKKMREELRSQVLESNLNNPRRVARELESIYRVLVI